VKRVQSLVGMQFGLWTVVEFSHRGTDRHSWWICRCDCGSEKAVSGHNLKGGQSKSCGCDHTNLRKHGYAGTQIHNVWKSMIERCTSKKGKSWASYGGRGITVCERWTGKDGFINFLADMGDRPDGASIDRIDNDGPYSPGNCRWATWTQQSRNKRSNRRLEFYGVSKTVVEWCDISQINKQAVYQRLYLGWPDKYAVFAPLGTPSPLNQAVPFGN
jgi:hypothetical protein